MAKSAVPAVIDENRVRSIAYALWVEDGQPDGRAEEHWFKALAVVNAEAGPVSAPKAAPKRKTGPVKAAAATKAAPRKRG